MSGNARNLAMLLAGSLMASSPSLASLGNAPVSTLFEAPQRCMVYLDFKPAQETYIVVPSGSGKKMLPGITTTLSVRVNMPFFYQGDYSFHLINPSQWEGNFPPRAIERKIYKNLTGGKREHVRTSCEDFHSWLEKVDPYAGITHMEEVQWLKQQ